MIYKFREGSQCRGKGNPQEVGEKLEAIRAKQGLTAKVVVAAAKTDKVLSPFFEWDDSKAAVCYREDQARHLIGSVVVRMESPEGEPVETRAFVNIIINDDNDREYTSLEVAMNDDMMRARLLERARRELESFRHKYKDLQELVPVFKAIDKVS